jgi:formate C-acetyltransferase
MPDTDLSELRAELWDYYRDRTYSALRDRGLESELEQVRARVWTEMDDYAGAHPHETVVSLKSRLHERLAEAFVPKVFRHTPFVFEMGLRAAENWGTPAPFHVGSWTLNRFQARCTETEACGLVHRYSIHAPESPYRLWNVYNVFDTDHHCLGYSWLLEHGVEGILDQVEAQRRNAVEPGKADFLNAVERSARAVLRIAERFRQCARGLLAQETDPQGRRFLEMAVDGLGRVPAAPPQSFYEALLSLWFLREVTASIEAVGVSVVGHLDRLLIDLYRADLAAGRMTREEAADLLARWMVPTDVKFHVHDNPWPETSTCMELGGCDAEGRPVFNELTQLILEVHREHGLLNPKPNCRFSADSDPGYLRLLGSHLCAGHNVFAFLNDDVLIPACERMGKTPEQARLYVNGGCQETIVEGVEHSAGAYYYYNMARALDLCLQAPEWLPEQVPSYHDSAMPQPIPDCEEFEQVYHGVLEGLCRSLTAGAEWRRETASRWDEVHPCPFFSATLEGCLRKGRDYSAGGAVHNPSGVALVGFATVVDSLHAIHQAVFEEGWVSFAELRHALTDDWKGHDRVRARLMSLPKLGHGSPAVAALARRFARDLAHQVSFLRNERGGPFQASFFVYYQFVHMATDVGATPDGRRKGDLLSQGCAPGRVRPHDGLTDVLHDLSAIDFRDFPGNAVLDLQLPAGDACTPDNFASILRTAARLGCPTLQPNCVSVDDLRQAQETPAAYPELTVRLAGLSVRFIALERQVQDEFIDRVLMVV